MTITKLTNVRVKFADRWNPATAYFLDGLLQYAGSPGWQPDAEVAPAFLLNFRTRSVPEGLSAVFF